VGPPQRLRRTTPLGRPHRHQRGADLGRSSDSRERIRWSRQARALPQNGKLREGNRVEGSHRPVRLEVGDVDLAADLRDKFGGVVAGDVECALELLKTAKLAERTADGWVVAWEELRVPGEKDLAHALATRACRPPSRGALTR